MRRLALLAAATLAVAAAPAARAEPLDVDLSRLGAPDPMVWGSIYQARGQTPAAGETEALARGARQRFAVLSSELALALSSAILHPASTTGYSGFAVDLEVATAAVHSDPVGATTAGYASTPWAGASTQPSSLYMPSVHVRKGLPFSLELGGRLVYLTMSNAYAGQLEAKWAAIEGLDYFPEVAVRGAYTRLFNVKDWNLSTTDLDLMVSKRFGFRGVTSLTPYVAARFTRVYASSDEIAFAPGAQTSFPSFGMNFYRTTAGLRFTAYSVALGLEATYSGGATSSSKDYDGVRIASSFSAAAKLGWEWW